MYVICRSETAIKSVRTRIASISNFQIIRTYVLRRPKIFRATCLLRLPIKMVMYYLHQIMGRSEEVERKNRTYLECALWYFSDNVVGQGELLEACD